MNDCKLPKMYICPVCGNVIDIVCSSGVVPMCCGQEMQVMTHKKVEELKELHLPVCEIKEDKVEVKVGEQPHPMTKEHHVKWIELITDKGMQRRLIYPKEEATASFCLCKNEIVKAVIEYCNIHGLWAALTEEEQDENKKHADY